MVDSVFLPLVDNLKFLTIWRICVLQYKDCFFKHFKCACTCMYTFICIE